MSTGLLVLIVGLVAVVLGFVRLWRVAEARADGLSADLERLEGEREALATRLDREGVKHKKQAEELAAQRKRNEKAKKRQARDGASDLPLGTASRVRDFEEQVERLERDRDRAQRERDALADQVATLEARLERSAKALASAEAAASSSAAVSSAAADASGASSSSSSGDADSKITPTFEADLAFAREREQKLLGELQVAKQNEAKMRKRMSNQEQLYASVRSELEVKKDRLRAQEERIQRLEALEAVIKA